MDFPVITKELVCRIASSALDFRDDRIRVLQELPDNPYGIEFRHFDHIQATFSTGGWCDTIRGLDIGDEERFDTIMALYRERRTKLPVGLFVLPGFLDESLARRFVAQGLFQAGFHTVLYGMPQPRSQQPEPTHAAPEITIEALRQEDIGLFKTLFCEGYGMAANHPYILTSDAWFGRPGWHLYLARVEGIGAATAILHVKDGLAYLAAGSTVPTFRRRGCQTALLRRRIADAHALGCDLIVGGGEFGLGSQHNQERAGLRIAYTYAKWQELGDG